MANLKHSLTLGRGQGCDLILSDETVSREHATLQLRRDGTVHVTDLDSANGTFVQESEEWRRVSSTVARMSDTLRFGAHEACLRDLLAAVPGVVLVGAPDEVSPAGQEGVVELHRVKSKPVLERPRRNPETGDIEDQH